jgi:hypothetical protein
VELLQDQICSCSPAKKPSALVVVGDEVLDFSDQLLDAREAASLDRSLGDDPKPAPHLVKPGGNGRCVVDMKPWPLSQPGAVFGVLISSVVVDHQVHVEMARDSPPWSQQRQN